jgi:hypothetical protein
LVRCTVVWTGFSRGRCLRRRERLKQQRRPERGRR